MHRKIRLGWRDKEVEVTDEELSILRAVDAQRDAQKAITDAANDLVKASNSIIEELQKTCKHRHTEHHPDASGNNDWSDECLICGKEGKRL